MKNKMTIFVYMLVCLLFVKKYSWALEIVTLVPSNCGQTSPRLSGIFLASSLNPPPVFSNDVNCLYTMYAYKNRQRIRFTIVHFDFAPNDCSTTKMEVFDGSDLTAPNLIRTVCPGDAVPITIEGTNSFFMTVRFTAKFVTASPKFDFCGYFSTFEDRSSDSICSFASEEVICDNKRCVNRNLTCDGLDACGDASDESTLSPASCDQSLIPDQLSYCPFGPIDTVKGRNNVTTTTTTEATTTQGSTDRPSPINGIAALSTILTLTAVLFLAYLFYWLLSIAAFNRAVTGCFRKCLLCLLRRNKLASEKEKKASFGSNSKISPMVEDLE